MKATLVRNDLLYPELSYKIIGCAFNVFKKLGSGHLEKSYQQAMAVAFTKSGLAFREEEKHQVFYEGEKLGYGKSDFLIENQIIVELKRGSYFNPDDFEQVKKYLASTKLELGIFIRFTHRQHFVQKSRKYSKNTENIIEKEPSIYSLPTSTKLNAEDH